MTIAAAIITLALVFKALRKTPVSTTGCQSCYLRTAVQKLIRGDCNGDALTEAIMPTAEAISDSKCASEQYKALLHHQAGGGEKKTRARIQRC